MANSAGNVSSERRLLKSAFSNFLPGGQEEESREKRFWTLANIPVTFQKALCPNGRVGGMVSSKISQERV